MPRVPAYYHVVADLLDASFAGTPIVYKNYPDSRHSQQL